VLKQITQYIKNNTTGFTIGTNLFAGFVPSTAANDIVVVRESGGATDADLVDKVEYAIQVLSRAVDYWVARANAIKVYDCLHCKKGITLPTVDGKAYYANVIQAITAPQNVGQDEAGLHNISTNFIIRIEDV